LVRRQQRGPAILPDLAGPFSAGEFFDPQEDRRRNCFRQSRRSYGQPSPTRDDTIIQIRIQRGGSQQFNRRIRL